MKVINVVLIILALVFALIAYLQGGNRHILGFTQGSKMLLTILPAVVCASLIAGYIQILLPETVIQSWLGKESGMNHPAASSGVSQSSFPRRRESRHEELDTRFRGYDKRSKLRGI